MKLKTARARLYRNIVDSGEMQIDDKVTCFVGKNESGKTALLQALYTLKPAYPNSASLNITMDYARWRKVRDERDQDLSRIAAITAVFVLEEPELEALCEKTGLPLPPDTELEIQRTYANAVRMRLLISESSLVKSLLETEVVPSPLTSSSPSIASFDDLLGAVESQEKAATPRSRISREIGQLKELVQQARNLQTAPLTEELHTAVWALVPKFFYFSEYSSLRGRVDLSDLLQKDKETLEDHERTALSLLQLVGVEGSELMETNFEERVAELEAAANEITRQIFEY